MKLPSILVLGLVPLFALGAARAPAQEKKDDAALLAETYGLEAKLDYPAAARVMKRVADAAPKSYFPQLRVGWLEACAGDYAKAGEAYAAAAALEPGAVEPLLGLQQALVVLERWDQAEKAGRDLLVRDPKSYAGLSRLAWTLYKKKDFKNAAETYGKVLALYPGDVEMRSGLAYAELALSRISDAAAHFRECLAMVPGHAGATNGLALCK